MFPLFSHCKAYVSISNDVEVTLNRSKYDGSESLMLHTIEICHPFQRNIFLSCFTIYLHDSHLGHVTWNIYINLISSYRYCT